MPHSAQSEVACKLEVGRAPRIAQFAPGLAFPCMAMRFARNEEIYAEGEETDFVYQVLSGAVRDVRFLSDGRRQVSAFHMPGDVFGLEQGATHVWSAEAVTDCEIAVVRRSLIRKAAHDDPGAGWRLCMMTANELQRLQEHVLRLGRKCATERVASFLVEMAARGRSGRPVELPMSRQDMADYLGLTIETVSRTLTHLEREHAISMKGSRQITLHSILFAVEP